MELIDKGALVAEIERICAEEKALFDEDYRMGFEPSPSPAVVCMKMECLLSFINTLEVKEVQEEPVSEDLEEEIIRYIGFPQEVDEDVSTTMIRKAAHHFANWQKKQDQSTIELAEDHAMLAGMEKMKEQMMAKAIDGTARPDDNEVWCDLDSSNLKDGDKVKVIVIKED